MKRKRMSNEGLSVLSRAVVGLGLNGRAMIVEQDRNGWLGLKWSDSQAWVIGPDRFHAVETLIAVATVMNVSYELIEEVRECRAKRVAEAAEGGG